MNSQMPIMLSCSAIANPAPAKFSWFRRNGTELIKIHPSLNSDHSLFVAISQDYDYASDGTEYYHQNRHHINDYALPVSGMGHTRQSIVIGVPPDANLDEYACIVANGIGESRPCLFEESPTSGKISVTGAQSNGNDNLFMVAASAGLIVFCLVLFSTVAIVFCFYRNRTSTFKGFGNRNSDVTTPQRFKLGNRPHLLDSSSSPEQLVDVDFMMDTRSKTSTLTAGYRMAGSANKLTAPLITGTLTKQYSRQYQNPYSTAGSVYSSANEPDTATGLSASRPFLVSYPSPNSGGNPVYAEPEYHCVESSNPSGDGQLTGSTSVTTSSGANSNTSNVQLLPPLPPDVKMRFQMTKFTKQGNLDLDLNSLTNQNHVQNDENSYQNNYSNYEEVKDPKLTEFSNNNISNSKKKRRKRNNLTNVARSSDYSRSSESSDNSESETRDNNANKDSVECLDTTNKTEPIEPDYESYEDGEDEDEDSSAPSGAYKPERDFFFIQRQQPQPTGLRNSISSNTSSGGSRRRLLPTSNKYGSLIRQQDSASPMRYTPQQYHQSPVSTRLYYNFDNPVLTSAPMATSPNNFYNSLRYGTNNGPGWRNGNAGGRVNPSISRQHSQENGNTGGVPVPLASLTESANMVGYRRSESNEPLNQPPNYHQTILDRYYE